jgi:hypothetical protein
MNRDDVYELIDGERDYQDALPSTRTDGREHTVGEYMIMMQYYMAKAVEGWTMTPSDQKALDNIRKIAAICVHCMEDYDTPPRQIKEI